MLNCKELTKAPVARFVVDSDGVYWSRYSETFEEIMKEHELLGGVRVEVTPPNDDMTHPLSEWVFKIVREGWAKNVESRARAALVDWAAAKLILGGVHMTHKGQFYVYNGKVIILRGTATARCYGGTWVVLYDDAVAWLSDDSSAVLLGNSRAVARDRASANLFNKSKVWLHDGSHAMAHDEATIIDMRTIN